MYKRSYKKIIPVLLLGSFGMLLLCGIANAQVPYLINYQGRLTDDLGDPVSNGAYLLTFRIWSDSISESPTDREWIDPDHPVVVVNGIFNCQLGSREALPPWIIANDTALWLGIQVGADPEISPRVRLTSVPYAYKAWKAEYAGYADSAVFVTSGGSGGGWVDDGSTVRLETSSDRVGIGTSSPTNRLHIVGSESDPLLYVQKTGSGRGIKVNTASACAIWVENSGNHGIRITNANGDGVHVTQAGNWAGYFNGKGYFSGDVGIGTSVPGEKLDVAGGSIRTNQQLVSTVSTGTAPMNVNSETTVTNLSADMVDGQHASEFAGVSHTHSEKAACADMYEGMTNSSSQITISFPVTFITAPHFSVTGYIKTGVHAGKIAYIPKPTPGTSSVTVTIQYWSGAIFMGIGDSEEVQLSYTAIEK
jgi:hypothetical protein